MTMQIKTVADDEDAMMRKALEKKDKKEAEKKDKKAATMKKPAAAAPSLAKVPVSHTVLAKGKKKRTSTTVTASDASRPPAPKLVAGSAATVIWRGGKIYTNSKSGRFRVLKRIGDRVDCAKSWKHHGSYAKAWVAALNIISTR